MAQILLAVGGVSGLLLLVGGIVTGRWYLQRHGHSGASGGLASSLKTEQLKSDIILNSIEDGVMVIDDQKTIQLFNPAAARLSGWTAEEAMGLDYHLVLKLVDDKNMPYEEMNDPLNRVFKENATVRVNNGRLITRSDKHLVISLNISPLRNAGGQQPEGAVAVFRDVSEEHREEERRAEFISTASHEMRTPVAAIEGYLALALNERVSKVDAKARGYLEKSHSSTQALGKLFQDLLTSAKAEDGRLSNHPVVVELGALLEQLTDGLRFSAQKKALLTEFVIGSSSDGGESGVSKVIRPLYYVYADPDRLREVVTNLFDNAVKYTETGKVSIGLTGNHEIVQFYIRDTGHGIPAEDIPHLFQKFYRVDSSATRTVGGTGLGLFITRKIIELYGGHIWVESEIEKGSSFFINLPRLSDHKAAQLQTAEAANTSAQPITSLTGS